MPANLKTVLVKCTRGFAQHRSIKLKPGVSGKKTIKTESLDSLDYGITTFDADASATAEEIFLHIFDTVDVHHGSYAYADGRAWSLLEVHGVCLSKQIESYLAEYGVMKYETFNNGFKCWR